jgi:hypothetical protein
VIPAGGQYVAGCRPQSGIVTYLLKRHHSSAKQLVLKEKSSSEEEIVND